MKKTAVILFTLLMTLVFAAVSFAGGKDIPNFAGNGGGDKDWHTDDLGSNYSKDWTRKQIEEFIKMPWTDEEKEKLLGPAELGYILDKEGVLLHKIKPKKGEVLTGKQLYENGRSYWMPLMYQYGLGMNMKTFKKIWIDEGKWKDPKHLLLDIRMESEYQQAHIPGAIRVDTGLDMWHLPAFQLPADGTYYLQCKSGTPADGGIRGALVARHMRIMGYTGDIFNLTDGFRGWIELGYPVINRHGQFTMVPGTFQKADPYFMKEKYPKEETYSPHP
ncbi:MAG: rhodanese-like domain-containing protein [Pseudomonadota bacterium]